MNIDAALLSGEKYAFLRENEHLGRHIMLLGLAGSYAYGTNTTESDVDIRGVALNSKRDLIGLSAFEQYVDEETDTTIYGFRKTIELLLSCNPNLLELLGLAERNYFYVSPLGQLLLDDRQVFLSKRAIRSFGGYADQQLRRLQNALARDSYPQAEKEYHIWRTLQNTLADMEHRYSSFDGGQIRLYLDQPTQPDWEQEIYMDVTLDHYPLRDYQNIWGELHNIVRDYDKLGKRNKKKDDLHLNKHAMHLIRLMMTAVDILEKGEIITYREAEHDLLMAIRRGDYQDGYGGFRGEFYELLAEYEKRLARAAAETSLPDAPDMRAVEELVMTINEKVVKDEF